MILSVYTKKTDDTENLSLRYYCLFFKHILFYEMVDGNGHKIYAFIAEKENMYDENKRKIKRKKMTTFIIVISIF